MADLGPQQANPLPENTFPVAGALWGANVPPVPRHPQAPPSPTRHPVPVQPHIHAAHGVEPLNALSLPANAAGHRRPVGDWEDVPPLVGNIASRGQPQDMQYNNRGYHHDMANYPPADLEAQYEYHDPGINYYARVAQGVPAHVQAIAPVVPEFHYAGQHAPARLVQAFLGDFPHQVPVFNVPAREVLRLLANRYLNELDSQVKMVRAEPGPDGGVRVVIALDLVDLLRV